MPVTRSKSKSPEPRPPPQTSTANQRKRQSAAPTGDVAADQSDALAILSAAATVPGPTTTDSLVDDRVDEIAARIEATRKKREDLEAEIARDQAALQLLRDHPRGALPDSVSSNEVVSSATASTPQTAGEESVAQRRRARSEERHLSRPPKVTRFADTHDSDSEDRDVRITGSSRPATVPDVQTAVNESEIAKAAADFVQSRFKFAATATPYTSFPSDGNTRCFEDRLTAYLRQALHDPDPGPVTLSVALGETAQAAKSLIPSVLGERVSAMIHSQVLNLSNALACIALKMGDAADVPALTRLVIRKVLRHLQNDGTDPAAFVRMELEDLRIAADMRLGKHSFTGAGATKSRAPPHATMLSSPNAQLPPGLGFAHTSTPFPPMVGMAGQSRSDKFRRWIRYPRDANGGVMMAACMLCGQGSTPGSVGHRADACSATPQQQEEWINHALPVK